jgi:hypothetical protein
MAKITYSALVSNATGSIDSITFKKSNGVSSVTRRARPTDKQTQSQLVARQNIGRLAKMWSGLTNEERASWNSLAWNYNNGLYGLNNQPKQGYLLFQNYNYSPLKFFNTIDTVAPPSYKLTSGINFKPQWYLSNTYFWWIPFGGYSGQFLYLSFWASPGNRGVQLSACPTPKFFWEGYTDDSFIDLKSEWIALYGFESSLRAFSYRVRFQEPGSFPTVQNVRYQLGH